LRRGLSGLSRDPAFDGLRWRDAPRERGPPKTLCNHRQRWSSNGIFAPMTDGLAAKEAAPKTVMIDLAGCRQVGKARIDTLAARERPPLPP
jgi:transposase